MKRSLFALLAVLIVIATVLAACGAQPTQPPAAAPTKVPPAPTAAPATKPAGPAAYACPKTGGVYKFNYHLPADRIGYPLNVIHYNQVYASFALEGLTQASLTEAGVFEPRLAVSWELAEDRSSITFELREGVKFHDGSDWNAEVAKWNFDTWLSGKTPLLGNVTSVEIVAPYTLKFTLSSWDAVTLMEFTRVWMISKKSFDENGGIEWADTHPVGTGPFKLVEFKPKQLLRYEKNPDYWNEGLPCLDGFEITQVPDPMTAIAMIKAGEVSALYQVDAMTANELVTTQPGYKVDVFPGLHNVIVMNSKDPNSVWSDIRMRQALEYAIDKESIVAATGFGFVKPLYEIVPGLHEAGGNPGTTPRTYDPAKARQLIAAAGHANGLQVTLTFSSMGPRDPWVALQANLADVGITVELNPVDDVALNQMSFEPPAGNDLRVEGQRGGGLFPLGGTKETLTSNSVYFPGLKRPAGFDDLVTKALASLDPQEQMTYLEQAEKLAYDDVMFVPLWTMPILAVDNGTIKDMIWSAGTPNPYFDRAYLP